MALILATSKQNLVKKRTILCDYCNDDGMRINEKKKIFIVNVKEDMKPTHVDNLTVQWCGSYVFLGSPFTCDGSVSHAAKLRATLKLPIFLSKSHLLMKTKMCRFVIKCRALYAALYHNCHAKVRIRMRVTDRSGPQTCGGTIPLVLEGVVKGVGVLHVTISAVLKQCILQLHILQNSNNRFFKTRNDRRRMTDDSDTRHQLCYA